MRFLRQTRAVAFVLWRFWTRRGLVVRRGGGSMRAPGLVLRGVFLALFAQLGFTAGLASRGSPHATAWMLLGLTGYGATFAASITLGAVRGLVGPLQAPLLDTLPLHEGVRVVARIAGQPQLFALAIVAIHTASPVPSLPRDVALGLVLMGASMLTGLAASRALAVVVAPIHHARAGVPLIVGSITSFLAFLEGPYLAEWRPLRAVADVVWPAVSGLVGVGRTGLAVGACLGVGAVASLAIALAERRGFDRIDALPSRKYARAAASELTLARIDGLLSSREPGARFVWVGTAYVALFAIGALWFRHVEAKHGAGADGSTFYLVRRGVLALASFMAFTGASGRAGRMAERDLVARSLLAPLPIAPADLLAGKVAPIRRQTLSVVAPILLLPLGEADWQDRAVTALRVVGVLGGAWVLSSALASISFMTAGAGAPAGMRPGASMPLSLERLLVYAPMLAIATASSPWAAAVSLGAFFLLSVEARRAALECVRWLDDKEDFARDTSVWRALLVLAAFMAVQTFAAQVLAWGAFTPITGASIAYCASAAVLVALTARERGGLRSIPISPRRMWSYAAGVGLGLASGAFVVGYFFLLKWFGVAAPNSIARSSALAAAMFVVFAPIAEEIFFRGWLQQAVGHEYARLGAAFQIVATAFAFAAIHPTLSYAPAFVFGLGAGALARASGGIGPGIVAHAMTNAVALYVA